MTMTDDTHPLVTLLKARQMLDDIQCSDELATARSTRIQAALEELDAIIIAELDEYVRLLMDRCER